MGTSKRISVAVIALAMLLLVAPSCTTSRSNDGPVGPTPTSDALKIWAPRYATGGLATTREAAAQARRFQVIGAQPWTYRRDVGAMKQDAPGLVVIAYMNATFAQKAQGDAYPSSWYLRDSNDQKVRSLGWGNFLMDPTNPGWIADRVEHCRRILRISGYDGCLLDMLGTAPVHDWYVTGAPIDPATGRPWTANGWLEATTRLASAVHLGSPGAMVIGNGLGDGGRFFDASAPSEQILTGIDGGIAETWLRTSGQPIDRYPSERAWRNDVDMLQTPGKSIFVETKVWTTSTEQQTAAWHRFALASFLLGDGGDAYFAFSSSRTESGMSADTLARSVHIGDPKAAYDRVDGVFQRRFSNGMVLVNPSDETLATNLGREYQDGDGNVIRTATLGPHAAMILSAS